MYCIYTIKLLSVALSAFTGGSSHPSGPNLGVTIICPALSLKGLENVHKVIPRAGSQAGLMRVKPSREGF
jgi:hypothetical protein